MLILPATAVSVPLCHSCPGYFPTSNTNCHLLLCAMPNDVVLSVPDSGVTVNKNNKNNLRTVFKSMIFIKIKFRKVLSLLQLLWDTVLED